MNNLKLLIISFYFPPFNRVGGRRWAKHCKYLEKENIDFQVLCGEFEGSSPWDRDIEAFKYRINRVPVLKDNLPYFKKELPNTFFQKLKWHGSKYAWRIKERFTSRNYYDPSINCEKVFLLAAEKIIKHNAINTVILSVGPFGYGSILIDLQKKFSKIKFVLDYRDPLEWIIQHLDKKVIERELKEQERMIVVPELVITPNEEMAAFYNTTFKKDVYVLPHCFDPSDLAIHPTKCNQDELSIMYGGAFFSNLGNSIKLVNSLVEKLSHKIKVNVNFYVSIRGYENELNNENIKRHDFLTSEAYFTNIANSDYVIYLSPTHGNNSMGSKFFELVASRKPILYFGNPGKITDFLIEHELGFVITPETIEEDVVKIIENKNSKRIPSKEYDLFSHTFEYHTKILIKKLQEL